MSLIAGTEAAVQGGDDKPVGNVVLAVHGGTGIEKKEMTPELDKQLRAVLTEALESGRKRLSESGAGPLDGVETAIRVLEDSPLLNAGRGAVFTHEGRNELDASIMDGRTKKAGAVAGVTVLKNPISAARAVMEKSKHVMMIGRGAEVFASRQGLEVVDPAYFFTIQRWKDLEEAWAREKASGKSAALADPAGEEGGASGKPYFGTVGAVARDAAGNLAAGTSTGGMTNKMFGRVGDSPIIGAGTYADNAAAAISCTGHGEYFIRYGVSHEIVSLMKYKQLDVNAAVNEVINGQLKEAGGEGAAIVLGKDGTYTSGYNTEGLYRGWITADGKVTVRLFEE